MSLKPTDSVTSGSNEDNPSVGSLPTNYGTSPGAGSDGPDSYSSYRYPGEGDSAAQYSSPAAMSVDYAKASYSDAPIDSWNTDDYREDGALGAGGPAWGVTDGSTGDNADYGPGVDTQKVS